MNRRQVLVKLASVVAAAGVAAQAIARDTAVVRQIALTTTRGKGKAKYKEDRGKRQFEVEVENVAPVGTVLTVKVNSVTVGTMTVVLVAGTRKAQLSLSTELGQTVPVIVTGSRVTVLNGTVSVATGTF